MVLCRQIVILAMHLRSTYSLYRLTGCHLLAKLRVRRPYHLEKDFIGVHSKILLGKFVRKYIHSTIRINKGGNNLSTLEEIHQ